MEQNKYGNILNGILVKKRGNWEEFIRPIHKKAIPIIIPSLALGYVFYQALFFFMGGDIISTMRGKLFLMALAFVYFWFVSLFFMLSALVYTIIDVKQKVNTEMGMDRLKMHR
ncbi:MAG: hypothetical protein L6408_01700 [Nanoarchaeota archaeon]|nr:hypothetical protein [Nanoarchaeota archaeon]